MKAVTDAKKRKKRQKQRQNKKSQNKINKSSNIVTFANHGTATNNANNIRFNNQNNITPKYGEKIERRELIREKEINPLNYAEHSCTTDLSNNEMKELISDNILGKNEKIVKAAEKLNDILIKATINYKMFLNNKKIENNATPTGEENDGKKINKVIVEINENENNDNENENENDYDEDSGDSFGLND